MKELLKKLFFGDCAFDNLIEGVYAHNYTNEDVRAEIAEKYRARYVPVVTPYTHPERFDPLNPPNGWAYDPYYEIWIEFNE
jgi:hypothetical protein